MSEYRMRTRENLNNTRKFILQLEKYMLDAPQCQGLKGRTMIEFCEEIMPNIIITPEYFGFVRGCSGFLPNSRWKFAFSDEWCKHQTKNNVSKHYQVEQLIKRLKLANAGRIPKECSYDTLF